MKLEIPVNGTFWQGMTRQLFYNKTLINRTGSSFSIIHNIGNVDNFALCLWEIENMIDGEIHHIN